ncbi:MAG TPA: aspartate kinase [Clostridia bacterium]|nr:aspartate kinase [Clostridia bacterium]
MRIIVQKFGGTSVATSKARARVTEWVVKAKREGYSPVVVVSAMGRSGDPYATDTLINLAKEAYHDTRPRELDLLASCGEIISSVVVTNTLRAAGLDAIVMTGGQAGIITNSNFGNAEIIRVDPSPVLRHLNEGKVVVVAGFQGVTEDGDVTTLGRGGSDTTAAALGVALNADVIEIYTDVDGIKTADPRLVPDARTINTITYEEILQMANEGAKVIHPKAVEIAMMRNIPLRIKCTFSEAPGTLITYTFEGPPKWPAVPGNRTVTGITHMPNVAQIKVYTPLKAHGADRNQEEETQKSLRKRGETDLLMFKKLAEAGISLDMISFTPEVKMFIIQESLVDGALAIISEFGLEARVTKGCSKVSVVGSGMRGVPGVMANVVEALERAGVPIIQTSDSHLTISCLVSKEHTEKAVRALHDQFGLAHV